MTRDERAKWLADHGASVGTPTFDRGAHDGIPTKRKIVDRIIESMVVLAVGFILGTVYGQVTAPNQQDIDDARVSVDLYYQVAQWQRARVDAYAVVCDSEGMRSE